ncbi:NAD-dependent epimerase/dehydratase family protein [Mycobacterium sp. 852002-51057_SCH5723018]|uniref:NAD-dependent epimerase/dehydratase family protein n=1 Tax=Mycobacterium sp. 852002-51057_SCH5723018 TaxID=1834094 RepID=UPI000800685F|nr:NAD-dependent epimerase/dehydratase family protein [Mycobacterium sp. 852002-51057_SCH5723018]OBG29626.1 epimerase [Mycobacterium sp. 852002-51057_SCH5723018]
MTGAATRQSVGETRFQPRSAGYQSRMRSLSRVLVTGGAGFLGVHLCERLLGADVEVVSVDDLSTSAPGAADRLAGRPGYRFVQHNICDPGAIEILGTSFDTVFHLASPASPVDYQRLPIATLRAGSVGTATALEIAERAGARFVLASTSEVYGDPEAHPQHESYWGNVNPVGPRSMYDEAKRYAEALTFAYHRLGRANVGVARIFNTYGPGMRPDDGRMVPTFCRQALRGDPLTVSGTGLQTRSLCYVDDTVEALIELAHSDFSGPVNVGNPAELTVLAVAELIRDLAGSNSTIQLTPPSVDDPQRRCPDITLARRELGWEPRVDYRTGLSTTVQWFRIAAEDPHRGFVSAAEQFTK